MRTIPRIDIRSWPIAGVMLDNEYPSATAAAIFATSGFVHGRQPDGAGAVMDRPEQ